MLGYPEVELDHDESDSFWEFAHPEVLALFGTEWDRDDLEELVYDKAQEYVDLDVSRVGSQRVLAADFLFRL